MATKQEMTDFLKSVEIGSKYKACAYGRWGGVSIIKCEVLRRTATQILISVNGVASKYRLDSGMRVGERFNLVPMPASEVELQEARDEIKRLSIARNLGGMNFYDMNLSQLERISAIVEENKNGDPK